MLETGRLAYDPYDPEVQRNPYPWYARLRATCPAYYVDEHDLWVLTRYDDLRRAAGDSSLTSMHGNAQLDAFDPESLPAHARSMASQDPPAHTELRRLVQSVFSQKLIRNWLPKLRVATERIVDGLMQRGPDGMIDVVKDLARPLPADVIMELMALPTVDRDQFIEWSTETMAVLPGIHKVGMDVAMRSGVATEALANYLEAVVAERAKKPIDGDIVSELIAARDEQTGRQLSREEVVGHSSMLVLAALETTEGTIGNLIATLLPRPDDLRRLRSDRSLIPAAMDEALRFEATAQGVFRTAMQDVEYGGVVIPMGSRIQLVWGSGNRDEEIFEDGDAFKIDREKVPALTFGHGAHYCLGAFLARSEMTTIVNVLFDRTKGIEAIGDPILNLAAMPVVRKHLSVPIVFVH